MATSGNGFTVNDILETDFETLFEVLNASSEMADDEDKVIPIEEFMLLHPEI